MTVTKHTRWHVEDGAEEVVVELVGDEVVVTWVCGDTRTFDVDDLEQAVAHVRSSKDSGAWVELTDSGGERFYAQVANGVLRVTDNVHAAAPRGLPWRELRKTLQKAAKLGRKA